MTTFTEPVPTEVESELQDYLQRKVDADNTAIDELTTESAEAVATLSASTDASVADLLARVIALETAGYITQVPDSSISYNKLERSFITRGGSAALGAGGYWTPTAGWYMMQGPSACWMQYYSSSWQNPSGGNSTYTNLSGMQLCSGYNRIYNTYAGCIIKYHRYVN